jgi:hypothetical protein
MFLVDVTTKVNNLNKPLIIGAQVLDFSKYLMYDYLYEKFDKRYNGNYKLIYTDTDSLII